MQLPAAFVYMPSWRTIRMVIFINT